MTGAQPTGLFAVMHASNVLESRLEARLSDVGLSLAKLAALHQLTAAGESIPLGQLAERLAGVKSNGTQLVDRLPGGRPGHRARGPNGTPAPPPAPPHAARIPVAQRGPQTE